jgi:hypothetical protein
MPCETLLIILKSSILESSPHERRAISDAPKPLERDFTEYDTPGRDIQEAVRSRSSAWLISAHRQLSWRPD